MNLRTTLLTASLATGLAAAPAFAGPVGLAYNANGQLFSFDLARPSDVTSIGTPVGADVKAIDVRPGTNTLYAIDVSASTTTLYSVDPATGARTAIGAGFANMGTMPGTYNLDPAASYGLDFNPTTLQVDGSIRIRFVNSAGQNLRLHSDTGGIAAVDGTLAYTSGTPTMSGIAAAAYTNTDTARNSMTAPATALYYIDTVNDSLVLSGNPNGGTFDAVGAGLGVDLDAVAGFDIFTGNGQNKAYIAVKAAALSTYSLHTVNLTTGVAGPAIGQFPVGFEPVGGFAIVEMADPALPVGTEGYSYTAAGQLIAFPLAGGSPLATRTIGSPVGNAVKGLDFRPGTTTLFSIDVGPAMTQLYSANPATGVRTAVGAGFANMGTVVNPYNLAPGSSFGFDFNPTTLQMDTSVRIRLVDSEGSSLRLNSDTGAIAAVDTALAYLGGSPAVSDIAAAAYTNSDTARTGATAPGTILYYIDTLNDNLVNLESNPNGGQFSIVGPLGFDASAVAGFEIFVVNGRNLGFAVLADGAGVYHLHSINLVTGAAGASLGAFAPASAPVGGLAIASIPDVTAPSVTIRNPRGARLVVRRPTFVVSGVAADARGITRVEYRVGPTPFRRATGTTAWRFTARLRLGGNAVLVRSYDKNGNVSAIDRTVLVRQKVRRR